MELQRHGCILYIQYSSRADVDAREFAFYFLHGDSIIMPSCHHTPLPTPRGN